MRAGDEEYEAAALRIRTWRREGSSEMACKMLKFPRTLPRAGAYIVTCHRVIALPRHNMVSGEIHRYTVRSHKVHEGI